MIRIPPSSFDFDKNESKCIFVCGDNGFKRKGGVRGVKKQNKTRNNKKIEGHKNRFKAEANFNYE